jgi:antitoxin (DNA-binding transcriptional repressor) of toxin-antitoxin stability system
MTVGLRPRALPRIGGPLAAAVAAAMLLVVYGGDPTTRGAQHPTPAPTSSIAAAIPGVSDDTPVGEGLTAAAAGYRLTHVDVAMGAERAGAIRFQILGPDGKPVTAFAPDQAELTHVYLLRTDLTNFQHVHAVMADDFTWSAPVAAAPSGSYRIYASFIAVNAAGRNVPLVLGQAVTVPGAMTAAAPSLAGTTAQVDGYTASVTGRFAHGVPDTLTVTVTKNGQPVADLQPSQEAYADVTALHEVDLAFARPLPVDAADSDRGGPDVSFLATFPRIGTWRLFVRFQTAGVGHVGAVTLMVR